MCATEFEILRSLFVKPKRKPLHSCKDKLSFAINGRIIILLADYLQQSRMVTSLSTPLVCTVEIHKIDQLILQVLLALLLNGTFKIMSTNHLCMGYIGKNTFVKEFQLLLNNHHHSFFFRIVREKKKFNRMIQIFQIKMFFNYMFSVVFNVFFFLLISLLQSSV